MARLRRERWYNSEGQQRLLQRSRRDSNPSWRVIRLVGMLAIVLVVMRKASDPNTMSNAFRQLGIPLESNPANPGEGSFIDGNFREGDSRSRIGENGSEAASSANLTSNHQETEDVRQEIWRFFLKELSPQGQQELAQHLLADHPLSLPFSDAINLWCNKVDATIAGWGLQNSQSNLDDESSKTRRWIRDWEQLRPWLANDPARSDGNRENGTVSFMSDSLFDPLRKALDDSLLALIVDGAPWRPEEQPALFRTLKKVRAHLDLPTPQSTPSIRPSTLLEQANHFRGRWVKLKGTIEQGPKDSRQSDPCFGEFSYQIAWIRPADGSTQPACVYLLEAIQESTDEKGKPPARDDDPSQLHRIIEIQGVFLKDLAYASERGLDVAPILVAGPSRYVGSSESPVRSPSSIHEASDANSVIDTQMRRAAWQPPRRIERALQVIEEALREPLESITSNHSHWNPTHDSADRAVLTILHQANRSSNLISEALQCKKSTQGISFAIQKGIVVRAEPLGVSPEDQEWFDSACVYRLTIEPFPDAVHGESPKTWTAIARDIPNSWKHSEVRQPVELQGIVVKRRNQTESPALSNDQGEVLLCSHLNWSWKVAPLKVAELKDSSLSDSELNRMRPVLRSNWTALGNAGWNLADIDRIKQLQKKPMGSDERTCFLNLLECCASQCIADCREELQRDAVPLASILTSQEERCLDATRFVMRLSRVTKIYVDPLNHLDLVHRSDTNNLGELDESNFYYELDGFGDIGNRTIRFMSGPDDAQPTLFEGVFPVTVVCKKPPQPLLESGQTAGKQVVVAGFFYRYWEYESGRIDGRNSGPKTQLGPIVFSYSIEVTPQSSGREIRRTIDRFTAIILLAMILGVTLVWWRLKSVQVEKIGFRLDGKKGLTKSNLEG